MSEHTPFGKEAWLVEKLDRLQPLEIRQSSTWTPCRYDPFFFDCSACELGWTSCVLRSDPDLRIYQAYRRIGDPATFAATGASDKDRSALGDRIDEILTLQGAAVQVGVLARFLDAEIDDEVDTDRVESIVAATPALDISSGGMVSKRDAGAPRQQYLGPWWGSHDVDTGQAIAQIQRSSSSGDRQAQHLLLKHYQAYALVQDCQDYSDALSRVQGIISDGLNKAVDLTGNAVRDLVLIATSPEVVQLNTGDKSDDKGLQGEVSKVLTAICAEELLNNDASLDFETAIRDLRTQILELNYPLVVRRALRFSRVGNVGFADLVQQGVLGLLRAIDKYDPYMGYQFSTYATWWVTQSITREIADSSRVMRIPVHVVEQINKISSAVREFNDKNVNFPNYQQLLDSQDLTSERLDELLGWATQVEVLDPEVHDLVYPRRFDEESYPATTDPALVVENRDDSELIESLLSSLPKRDSRVIRLRFGLEDGRPRTLEEVGTFFGLTRERIRQIERKSLGRIRTLLGRITADPTLGRDEDDSIKKWASKAPLSSTLKTAKNAASLWRLTQDHSLPYQLVSGLKLANEEGLEHLEFKNGDGTYGILDPSSKLSGKLSSEWGFVPTGTNDSDWTPVWIFAEKKQETNLRPLFDKNGARLEVDNQPSSNENHPGSQAMTAQVKGPSNNVDRQLMLGDDNRDEEPDAPPTLDPEDPMSSVIEQFLSRGVDVIDNRSKLGALWVVVDDQDPDVSKKLSDLDFRYLRKGVKATNRRPAWFKK